MSKKKLKTQAITNELKESSVFFNARTSQKMKQKPTRVHKVLRDKSRDVSRKIPRELPTRDEVQEFSFRLRDELKVKVQAEVPHQWQEEFEEVAHKLRVRKLELYRFILGEFLGKVQRKRSKP
jgi:hypothetical protein